MAKGDKKKGTLYKATPGEVKKGNSLRNEAENTLRRYKEEARSRGRKTTTDFNYSEISRIGDSLKNLGKLPKGDFAKSVLESFGKSDAAARITKSYENAQKPGGSLSPGFGVKDFGPSKEEWDASTKRKEFMHFFRGMQKPKEERMRGYAGEKAPAPASPAAEATFNPEVTSPDLEEAYERAATTGKGIQRPPVNPKTLTRAELTKARQGFADELKGLYGKLGREGEYDPEDIASGVAQRATRDEVFGAKGIADKAAGLGLRQKDVSDFLQKTYAQAPEQKAALTQGDKKQKIRQSIAGKQETPGARYEREKKGQDARQKKRWDEEDRLKKLREKIAGAKRSGAAPVKQGERDSSMAATEETEQSVTYRGTGGMMDLYNKKPKGTGTGIASGANKPASTSFLR